MSLITPKTIVITTYPGTPGSVNASSPKSEISLLDTLDTIDFDSDGGGGGSKKRRRLTHLSPDEKLLRRKLKNRVAAQTARDRKKALMTELEERVAKLVEENKHLRRQNIALKETSNTLVKENTELKSRLSDPSLTSVKTESETSSTCCSSAEGAGSDSDSMVGTVLGLCNDAQPDDFLGLLQEITGEHKLQQPQTQTDTSTSQSVCGGRAGVSPETPSGFSEGIDTERRSPGAESRNTAPRMVGLSPAELESLNELIHIDHFYVKPQPLSLKDKAVVDTKPSTKVSVAHKIENNDIQKSRISVFSTGVRRNHKGEIIEAAINKSRTANSVLDCQPADLGHSRPTVARAEVCSPCTSPSLNIDNMESELISSLSASDMEHSLSLNFLEDLELDTSDISDTKGYTIDSFLAVSENSSHCLSKTAPSVNELNTSKLFDEIYEHYLSIKDSDSTSVTSPIPPYLSDSGVSSDTSEALSPLSSEGSLIDDLPWHDPFIDLFPDLQ